MIFVGFPEKVNVEEFRIVCDRTQANNPEAMTRLAALFANQDQVGATVSFL